MNVVILGILSKTTILMLGMMGLLFGLARRMENRRRRVVPRVVVVSSPFGLPVRTDTRRLVSSPSRAPPGVTDIRQGSNALGSDAGFNDC